ncbi:hypothetical protein NHX12_009345 [Muraenolepis orangiensis]|uniref:Uncharacterized protein n=1 Tax=Muraenolepis orangiensis TaxID=630683 RepID=A0A9Q0IAR2_9TELE|nr:hypothetical protein NHX12_009345 [Muraenolepis orangiensis]
MGSGPYIRWAVAFCSARPVSSSCMAEGTSLEEQVRRIKDIEAIESDSFVPQAFKSSRDDIKCLLSRDGPDQIKHSHSTAFVFRGRDKRQHSHRDLSPRPQSFSSTKKKKYNISGGPEPGTPSCLVKQEDPTEEPVEEEALLPTSIRYNDTDTLAHPSLFVDKEKAEELWLKRLVSLRQERLMGSPVT